MYSKTKIFLTTKIKLIILLTLCGLSAVLITFSLTASYDDGPYVFSDGDNAEVWWLCDNQKKVDKIENYRGLVVEKCNHKAKLPLSEPEETSQLNIEGDFKVLAASDIHGQFDLFLAMLKRHNIVDQNNRWLFGNNHFVITGDIFDRGPDVLPTLWFLYELEQQAKQSGGGVHLILGNHEVMVLNGDLRYLHAKYLKVSQVFNIDYDALFSNETLLGRWLRSRPAILKINDAIYAHGGFHPQLAKQKLSLNDINRTFKSALIKKEMPSARQGLAEYLHKTNGVIWYRGYFRDDGATAAEIELLLNHFDVNKIIVGHTSQTQIETRYQGKVIAIDASMKKGEYGEMLLIDGDNYTRLTLDGKRIPLF